MVFYEVNYFMETLTNTAYKEQYQDHNVFLMGRKIFLSLGITAESYGDNVVYLNL